MNADSAKFCAECGTALRVSSAETMVSEPRQVTTANTSEAMPLGEGPTTPDSAPATKPGVQDDTIWNDAPKPRGPRDTEVDAATGSHEQDFSREREMMASFGATLMRVITTPVVAVTAIAAALAVALTFVLAAAAYALITTVAGGDLPGDAGQWWDFGWVAHFSSMQVPLTLDDSTLWTGPMLLLAVVVVSCCAALLIARTVFAPRITSDAHPTSLTRYGGLVFAGLFLIANLILAAFGPEDTGVQWFMVLVLPTAIAYGCYALTMRTFARRTGDARTAASRTSAATSARTGRSWVRLAAVPATVLAMMVAFAAALTLIVNIVQVTTTDDSVDTRAALTWDVTRVIDQGWSTVNYGWLGRSSISNGEDDTTSNHIWDLQDDDARGVDGSLAGVNLGTLARADLSTASFVLLLIAAFGTVVLGAIYAGFRTAYRSGAGSSTRAALLAGAYTGPVWFVMSILASLVLTDRAHLDNGAFEGGFSLAAGVDGAFLALAAGTLLGALGGLLSAHASSSVASYSATRGSNDLPSSGAMPSS